MKLFYTILLLCLVACVFAQIGYGFSDPVVLDNRPPDLNLGFPTGNESLYSSSVWEIRWTASDLHLTYAPISIEYSLDGGESYTTIIDSTSNDGSYFWRIPSVASSNALLRITATDIFGLHNAKVSGTFNIPLTPSTYAQYTEPPAEPTADYLFSVLAGGPEPNPFALFAPSLTEFDFSPVRLYYSTNPNILANSFTKPENLGAYWGFNFLWSPILTSGRYLEIQLPVQPNQLWYRYDFSGWQLVPGYNKEDYYAPNFTYRIDIPSLGLGKGLGDLEFAGDNGEAGETLPVELSSFTAITTADYFVNLQWTAQSETNLSGYNVLRNGENNMATAICVSNLIPASNSSTTTHYTFTDTEVQSGNTYYYWLQSLDLSGEIQTYGPVSVTVIYQQQHDSTPEIQAVTRLLNVFPNPFNPTAHIPYQLITPETVKVSIFNCKGQLVRTYTQKHPNPGFYSIVFDGRDERGRALSSGVYLCEFSAGQYRAGTKLILMK